MDNIKVLLFDNSFKEIYDDREIVTLENVDFSKKDENSFYLVVMNDCNEDRNKLDLIIDFVDCVYVRNFKNISKIIYNKPVIADQNEELIQTPYLFVDGGFEEIMEVVRDLKASISKLAFPILERIKSEEVSCRMVDITGDDGFKIKLH